MHHLLIFITAASFWATLPVRLVAVAGIVYVMVQAIKQIFPNLGGNYAIALNVALSVAGNLTVAQPGDLASVAFWSSLLMTAAAAAGIHGTVKQALGANQPAVPAETADALPRTATGFSLR